MDRLFGLDKVSAHSADTELLVTVYDEIEKTLICGILADEQIPYLCRDRGSGEMTRILAGYSSFGCDIFVPKAAHEKASELLNAYRNGAVVEEPLNDGDAEIDD